LGIYYTNSTRTGSPRPGYNSIKVNGRTVPYLRFADDNNNALSIASKYRETFTDSAGTGLLLNWKYYPLEDYKHSNSTAKLEGIVANIAVNYQVIKGLTADVSYQY